MIARLVRYRIPTSVVQSIFAIFYAVFSTGALEKATSMRVSNDSRCREDAIIVEFRGYD